MKLLKFVVTLACILTAMNSFSNESYGNIIQVDNQYEGSLYIVSTDPTPGKFNNAPGCQKSEVTAGQKVSNDASSKFYVPWENTGGKIYVWLKNKQGKIVSAAKLYDKDDIIYFKGDQDLISNPNVIAIIDQKNKSECQTKHGLRLVQDVQIKLTATQEGQIQFNYRCPGWAANYWNDKDNK